MVNKCVAHGCKTGYASEGKEEDIAVFKFPNKEKYPELRAKWVRWVNRQDFTDASSSSAICEKHFNPELISRGSKCRLKMGMNPVPSIHSAESLKRPSCLPTPDPPPRKQPKLRGVYEDEMKEFNKKDIVHNFSELSEDDAPTGFQTKKEDDCIVYYRIDFDEQTKFPALFESIRIDNNLHVQLQYNGIKVPLPSWFTVGRNAQLNRKSIINNFPPYIQSFAVDTDENGSSSIMDELQQRKYMKPKGRPPYSAAVIRYALLLRYTSAQAYQKLLKEFPLPSFSLLNKIMCGGIDSLKALKKLREVGKISNDIILMADEMYLQKASEWEGGEYVGEDEDGNLFKGLVTFMVVGLKSNTPYVIKACPEVSINGSWLSNEMDRCIDTLAENGFRVRAVVTDNHSTNVNAFASLKKKYGSSDGYSIQHPKNHDKKPFSFSIMFTY